jgi:opacity protein-like surface antigen
MLKKCAFMAALVLALSPAAAHADWLFTPSIGTGFGGSATGSEHLTYGASIGWMGAGVLGWEADLAYTPEFFEGDDDDLDAFDDNNVTSFMANVIVGVPVGGQTGGGVRPYFSGGAGIMQSNVSSDEELFDINSNEFGINLGGGVMGFVSDHVGFRGDVRYYRALTDPAPDGDIDLDLGDFNFWRGTAGITFRW